MIKEGYQQTEIGILPKDWEVSLIGDEFYTFSGGTPDSKNLEYYNGNINWISSGELNQRIIKKTDGTISKNGLLNSAAKMVLPETLLMAMYGATAGISAITKIDGAINQAVIALEPKSKLDIYFYLNFLELKKDWIINTYTQGGQPNLNGDIVKKIQIPLPPISEQEKIAEALSDCDAWIESTEQLLAKKKLLKQGAMQQLLSPKEDWEVKTLKEIADFRRGSFPQPYGLDKWYDDINGMPFIQVYDVNDNFKLKDSTKRKISNEAQNYSVFAPKNTIVLTIQGSIGRIAITHYDAYVDRTLLIFGDFKIQFDKEFFMLSVFQLFELEKEKAPGGIIKTITKEVLSSFQIKFPPLSEQRRISGILSDMDSEIASLEATLHKARQIKQGMMQDLLTGKVRL